MKRFCMIPMILTMMAPAAMAAGDDGPHMTSGANVYDIGSVQRGAALFVNYCQSCHSAEYMRYQRLAQDLELSEAQLKANLIFDPERGLSDYMTSAMSRTQAAEWLQAPPPDLTLAARSRGGDWIYTFLNSFYLTDDGWNNWKYPNSRMPHVLWELQGVQRARTETDEEGHEAIVGLELAEPGSMSEEEYRLATRDLVAFMQYLAEPGALKRKKVGVWVVLSLALLSIMTYLLYKEYWRDIR